LLRVELVEFIFCWESGSGMAVKGKGRDGASYWMAFVVVLVWLGVIGEMKSPCDFRGLD